VTSNVVWPLASVALQVTFSMQGTATWSTWNEPDVVLVRPGLDALSEYVPGATTSENARVPPWAWAAEAMTSTRAALRRQT
jgi:hypothetical protein